SPTTGPVTVTDTLPAGLTAASAGGSGWNCTVGPTVTCSRSDALAGGNTYPPIVIKVNIDINAPATVTNPATVSGGGDVNPGNNTATDTTTIPAAAAPDLSISKTHAGSLTPGQTAAYAIVVSNGPGTASTAGSVTVSDTLPTGLTATSAAGIGWSCAVGPTVT